MQPQGPAPAAPDFPLRALLVAVVMTAFASALLLAPVNVAVPPILADFAIGPALGTWLPLAYLLTVAVTIVPAGRIAERVGRSRVFVAALLLASVGSVAAALAPSYALLLVARILQGLGAGMGFAVSNAMITAVVPPKERGEKLGLSLMATYLGLTLGPFIGGALTSYLHWRVVFLVPVPLLLVALVIALTRLVPKEPRPEAAPARFDLLGALLYAVGILGLMGGVSALPDGRAIGLALVGALAMAAFVRHGLKADAPVFNVRLFAENRLFARSCLASVLMYAAIFSNTFVMALVLQDVRGLSAASAGLVLVAQPVFMATLARRVGRLSDRVEPRFLSSAGLLLCMAGLLLLSLTTAAGALMLPLLGLALCGLGMALFSAPNHNAIMGSVARPQIGAASAALAVMRILGQMLSMVVVASVFSLTGVGAEAGADPSLLLTAARWALRVAAVLCVLGVWVSWNRGELHGDKGA